MAVNDPNNSLEARRAAALLEQQQPRRTFIRGEPVLARRSAPLPSPGVETIGGGGGGGRGRDRPFPTTPVEPTGPLPEAEQRAAFNEMADPLKGTDFKGAGLSRVVKTADGVYTDDANAEGDVRYYDALGSRADRAQPAGITANTTPAEFFARQNAGQRLLPNEIFDRGRQGLQRRNQMIEENRPKLSVDQMKTLAEIEKLRSGTRLDEAEAGRDEVRFLQERDTFERGVDTARAAEFDALAAQHGPAVATDVLSALNRDPQATPGGQRFLQQSTGSLIGDINSGDNFLAEWAAGLPAGILDNRQIDPKTLANLSYDDFEVIPVDGGFWMTLPEVFGADPAYRVQVKDGSELPPGFLTRDQDLVLTLLRRQEDERRQKAIR